MSDVRSSAAGREFLVTKEYRRFAEFCDAVRRERYIGVCYGPTGVGKTLSARHYTQWDIFEDVHSRPPAMRSAPTPLADCRSVFYTALVSVTPWRVEREVRSVCYQVTDLIIDAEADRVGATSVYSSGLCDGVELLLVDEADRLKLLGLEQLRDLYDREHIGLVLIGMPGLEKRLARYAQLYSRIGFFHAYRPLSDEEVQFMVAQRWQQFGASFDGADFTDQEALGAVRRITGGNFRLLQRLLAQIRRILAINELCAVTKEVVETARESLVIGES